MVAKLSADHGAQFDLGAVWENQAVSPELARVFEDWAPRVHAAIITGAGRSNVTEWCKKDESWNYIKALDLPFSDRTPQEVLSEGAEIESERPSPQVNGAMGGDESLVEMCCAVDGKAWVRVVAWCTENRVPAFDQRVSNTISGYALGGWKRRPSLKQARIGARVLRLAARAGIVELPA
jgi:hypothetical protein